MSYNYLTRYLHQSRFRILVEILAALSTEEDGRRLNVFEIGCGTGNAFAAINTAVSVAYVGIDYVPNLIETAKGRFVDHTNCVFVAADAADTTAYPLQSFDVVFALETLEHIPEHDVVRIIEHICHVIKPRLFLASVPVEIGPSLWIKNIGSMLMGYGRYKEYTPAQTFWAGLYHLNKLPPHGIRHLGFNWFWLEQTIRHNTVMRETRSMPFRLLPKFLAPSVMFIAEPQKKLRFAE